MQDLEQAIRERAYHLWLADGARDGQADAHWLVAQREVLTASLAEIGRVTVSEDDAAANASKKASRKSKAVAPSKAKRRAA